MLLIECVNIEKYFAERRILEIEDLKIYSKDRIGVVGPNGIGKTTLLKILSKRLIPDSGVVNLFGKASYISQLEQFKNFSISLEMASKYNVDANFTDTMSGGEKTKFKVAKAFGEKSDIMFADEPTSNVDIESINRIEHEFKAYKGAIVVISHDRDFLDGICNKIIEIEDGKIKIYDGNYSEYKKQKEIELTRKENEYKKYVKEKNRLKEAIFEVNHNSQKINKTPKRMGISEARLHKMGGQRGKANLDRAKKSIETRLNHLETKQKPKKKNKIKLDIVETDKSHSKVMIEGRKINKAFGEKVIFENADFIIENNTKVAIIGPNGCGKSTLVKMIKNKEKGIKISKTAKIGYFDQEQKILNENKSIIDNVTENCIYSENFARTFLARLLFKKNTVYKKVKLLSGGEIVKVSLAKILLEDNNMLILDEPTNYLDINSIEVIEEAFLDYDRALLFVSHDRHFISNIANQVMTIEDKKIKIFRDTYQNYLLKKEKADEYDKNKEEKKLLLNNQLSEIVGKISMESNNKKLEELDVKYKKIIEKLKQLDD